MDDLYQDLREDAASGGEWVLVDKQSLINLLKEFDELKAKHTKLYKTVSIQQTDITARTDYTDTSNAWWCFQCQQSHRGSWGENCPKK